MPALLVGTELLPPIHAHSFAVVVVGVTRRASGVVRVETPAEVPAMITVAGPVAAVELAVSVSVLLPAVGFGLNDAVTPLGRLDAASVTLLANPPKSVTVTVLTPDAPGAMDRPLGLAESAKPGPALTVSASVRVAVGTPEEVPVMVTAAVPVAAVELAVSVSALLPVVGFVPKDAVTPLGRPDAARVTPPVNPFWGSTMMVDVADAPWVTARAGGEAPRVKAGVKLVAEFTCRYNAVEELMLLEKPVTSIRMPVPTGAELLADRVRTLVPVVGFGLNDAVRPAGNCGNSRKTLPENPFCGFTVTVSTAAPPCVTATKAGKTPMVKFGGAAATTCNGKLKLAPQQVDEAVTWTRNDSTGAVLLAVSVRRLVPPGETEAGLNVAVTPVGSPEADRVAVPVTFPKGTMVTPAVTEPF